LPADPRNPLRFVAQVKSLLLSQQGFYGVDKSVEISNLELITDMEKIISMEQALSLKTIKLQYEDSVRF